ncbi:MAG: hypothetical protein V3T86_03620 [Planctomycetota bacterium]
MNTSKTLLASLIITLTAVNTAIADEPCATYTFEGARHNHPILPVPELGLTFGSTWVTVNQ